ncbi:hypothetical protein [Hyphobacterium sp. CCMP332]|uniref:hypothetical protein n=1 Tax=Hyphobacterium sp. CCMP332 TaxID=2749086 RepID=UPI001F286DF2|nr:hypothetical protein [Hyphobacterium sp. CCMP332]
MARRSHDDPESGNGVSDLLDEARIHLEFMLAMQIPDGARVWAVAHQGEAPESGVPLAVLRLRTLAGWFTTRHTSGHGCHYRNCRKTLKPIAICFLLQQPAP